MSPTRLQVGPLRLHARRYQTVSNRLIPTEDSPIRLIDDIDPVKGASNPNLSCGQNAQNAALVVPANPGSQVAFSWSGGGGGNVSLSHLRSHINWGFIY